MPLWASECFRICVTYVHAGALPVALVRPSRGRARSGGAPRVPRGVVILGLCLLLGAGSGIPSSAGRLGVTSSDVIHALALPTLGLKVDVVTGRVNAAGLCSTGIGALLGQCSEICGAYHGHMPLLVLSN